MVAIPDKTLRVASQAPHYLWTHWKLFLFFQDEIKQRISMMIFTGEGTIRRLY
jgi:hypothetical protein